MTDDNDAWEEPKLRCQVDVRRQKRDDCEKEATKVCNRLERRVGTLLEHLEDISGPRLMQAARRAERLREEVDMIRDCLQENTPVFSYIFAARDLVDYIDRSINGERSKESRIYEKTNRHLDAIEKDVVRLHELLDI